MSHTFLSSHIAPAPFQPQHHVPLSCASSFFYVYQWRVKRPNFHMPALSIYRRAAHRPKKHLKSRESICFVVHCVSSLATTLVDVEKLWIPSLEDHSTSGATVGSLTYTGAIGPPVKTSFEATSATDTFLTIEEALIPIAAAEAIALAKAAVEVAKNAAMMSWTNTPIKLHEASGFPSEADVLLPETARLTELEHVTILGPPATTEIQPGEENLPHNDTENFDERDSQLELLEMQLSKSIAARSGRRTERKARRERAAEKAILNVTSVKSGSSSKKKQSSVQDVDYSDPLRYLRGTTSTAKLLTANEEQELSEGIQELLKLEKVHEELAQRYGGQPTFSQWAAAAGLDQKTLRNRLNYGLSCKERMIKSNIRLVISVAKNYLGTGMNIQDLVQEGCRGLVKGAEKFDASKGFKFSTYAHWWIKQAIRKSLSDQLRTIRVPYHIVDASYRVKEATRQLYTKNGKHPSNEEIAAATGLSMKRLATVISTPKASRSLDQKTGIDQNLKPSEVIAGPDAETPEDVLMKQSLKKDMDKVLDSLSSREKQVVRLRFGLDNGRMKTLQEIGEMLGVSRERIRQIESCAFRKLKNKKRTEDLKQYLIS